MSKNFFFFIFFFSFFVFSLQLECTSFGDDETCGGHNAKYNLQCHQFSSSASCTEVEVDDGCTIDEQHKCKKVDSTSTSYECFFYGTTTMCKRINVDSGCKATGSSSSSGVYPDCSVDNVQSDEDCFMSTDYKTCSKKKKACTLYSSSGCGGLETSTITGNNQCAYFSRIPQCKEIAIDEYCQVKDGVCGTRTGGTAIDDSIKKHCKMNDDITECKLKVKECNEFSPDSCSSYGNTCFKVRKESLYTYTEECKIVTINERCKIDNGICKAKYESGENALKAYEKCSYNSDYSKCELINKECNEITDTTQCSNCKIPKSGFTCSKIKMNDNSIKCNYVQTDSQCQINNNGECLYPSSSPDTTKKTCIFNEAYSKCQYYEAGAYCKLSGTTSLTCVDNTVDGDDKLTDDKLICDFDEDTETKCNTRKKECSDYKISASCEGVREGTKKCSWNYVCQEYTTVPHCTVINGECKRLETVSDDDFGTNQVCLFDLNTKDCKKKEKKCENHYENCEALNDGNKKCVKYNVNDYCISIEIDENCQVSGTTCINQETLQSTEICSYNDVTKPSTCKKRNKVCGDYYPGSSCNAVQNCAFIGDKCYQPETDGNCVIQNGNCEKKTDIKLEDYEKCDFVYKEEEASYRCEKTNKYCHEYGSDSTKCNAHPRTADHQCYKFSSSSTCKNVTLDGICYVNSTGQCVEDGSGKLSTNEICDFNSDKSRCEKREKQCNDYKDSTCGNYSPQMKLCFKINGSCKEVKVDDQCSMNENNECTGNSCQFDEKKDKCYYQNNNNNESSLMKINQIILIILFFMF